MYTMILPDEIIKYILKLFLNKNYSIHNLWKKYNVCINGNKNNYYVKDGALSAFLPPVGRRSFKSRKMNVFLYAEELCFEIISLITYNKILKRLFNFLSI